LGEGGSTGDDDGGADNEDVGEDGLAFATFSCALHSSTVAAGRGRRRRGSSSRRERQELGEESAQ